MDNCDCCSQPNKYECKRKPNYQKLVEISRPQYQSILNRRSTSDKGKGRGKNEPCSALAATRGGVKHLLHMPCAKYGLRDEPKAQLKKTNDDDCIGKKIVVCLPCDKPKLEYCKKNVIPFENVRVSLPEDKLRSKPDPVVKDYMYRCESKELLGSRLLKCECVKRNGLQDRCPRTPCLGRPACLEKPWPNCWPSGGSNGIDYSRTTGVQRVNPSFEYWRDSKKCVDFKEIVQN